MIFVIFVAALLITVAATSYYTYKKVFLAKRKKQEECVEVTRYSEAENAKIRELIRSFEEIPPEDVYITSFDGLRLHAAYYHVADGAPLDIQFHGYNGNAVRDFCGGNKVSRDAGRNSLVIDHRAHGRSEGKTITFGVKERTDCLSWVEYAVGRFGKDVKISLAGVSMGAATVLMASSLELPENVRAIVADCGYSSPSAIIKKVAKDRGLPPSLVYPFIWLGAFLFGGFRLNEASAAEAVSESRIPILIIHGEEDGFVPCYMAREIYDACASEKKLLTVPGAGHGLSYLADDKLYEKTVNDFLEKYLKTK